MRKTHAVPSLSIASLSLVACMHSQPSQPGEVEILSTAPVVTGSSFQCTGTWPSALTPCAYSWSSQAVTRAFSPQSDIVELTLLRFPMPVDGGASTVSITLQFVGGGLVTVKASESTTQGGTLRTIETSKPVSGWIDPAEVGSTPSARNADKFSLTFAWGSISGTYDTAQ